MVKKGKKKNENDELLKVLNVILRPILKRHGRLLNLSNYVIDEIFRCSNEFFEEVIKLWNSINVSDEDRRKILNELENIRESVCYSTFILFLNSLIINFHNRIGTFFDEKYEKIKRIILEIIEKND